MIFKDWQAFSAWLKTLPTDEARIDAMFDDTIIILEPLEAAE